MELEPDEPRECVALTDFVHFDEVVGIIDEIQQKLTDDKSSQETYAESLTRIFDYYLENPQILDPYLERLLSLCLNLIKSSQENPTLQHFLFHVIYLMVKVRGYKSIVRLMPHTVDDVEPTLQMLSEQDLDNTEIWKTRYVLLLWLSILIMVPFGLHALDEPDKPPLVDRLLFECKRCLACTDATQEAAAFLLARLVTRPDVIGTHLNSTISWAIDSIGSADYQSNKGQLKLCGLLRLLANICKIGPRQSLLPLTDQLFDCLRHHLLTSSDPKSSRLKIISLAHFTVKLLQRIGLVYAGKPPTGSLSWQYQRGCRSLADNLADRLAHSSVSVTKETEIQSSTDAPVNGSHSDSSSVAIDGQHFDQVAELVDWLVKFLSSNYTPVRWSAAKGIGRLSSRFTSPMVNDVISVLLGLCNPIEPSTAWHGACLALAELGRRSLLLPTKLPEVIPIVLRALAYDQRSGDHNYGSNVRDAACYVCWSFARALDPVDIAPWVTQIASHLIMVSLFDREVSVRRAAGAAIQENVGRQGQFPHGIDLITTCDYFAVQNRSNCFLELSVFVAQFDEYRDQVIKHLLDSVLSHWDPVIRRLASQALGKLAAANPDHALQLILPRTIERSLDSPLCTRQGNIFATGEVLLALKDQPIPKDNLSAIQSLVPLLIEKKLLYGMSGALLRKAASLLIQKISLARLPFHSLPVIETWQIFLDDSIRHTDPEVQKAAVEAYPAFLSTYLHDKEGKVDQQYCSKMLDHLLDKLISATSETCLTGYLQVIGNCPLDLIYDASSHSLAPNLLENVTSHSTILDPVKTASWGRARSAALRALVGLIQTVIQSGHSIHPDVVDRVTKQLLLSMDDYTIDSRGDIGSFVRQASIESVGVLFTLLADFKIFDRLPSKLVEEAFARLIQQGVEKLDKLRGVATNVFTNLLYHEDNDSLVATPRPGDVYPFYVQLLHFDEYRFRLLLGLLVSVGGLIEHSVIDSSTALTNFLQANSSNTDLIADFLAIVEKIFNSYARQDRILLPWLKFLDFLINDPVMSYAGQEHFSFGGMLQIDAGSVRQSALGQLVRMLSHRYPIIRKTAATKLYECQLAFDLVDFDAAPTLSSLLESTVWESDLPELKPTIANIRSLLDLPPIAANGACKAAVNNVADNSRPTSSAAIDAGDDK